MLTHPIDTTHTPSQLVALIITHYPNWQACFLHNAHRPIIGICPTVSWTATFTDTLLIDKHTRHAPPKRYVSTYTDWQDELIAYCQAQAQTATHKGEYMHGLMGFIGYDLPAHELDASITIKSGQPCAYFGHYDIHIKPCDHGFTLIGINTDKQIFDKIKSSLTELLNQALPKRELTQFISSWQRLNYNHAFNKIQKYIKAGDTYQINLTQKWQADLENLVNHLPHLQDTINAPFAGFLKLGEFEILSVSPELFFEFNKTDDGIDIITKPIKGTRPRHDDASTDNELKNELANSEKDISENLMIVDLLRNDLGKYAHIGTVKTPKRFVIESFQNVHHMVSTINAQLKDVHSLAVLFGSLPAGSITGTPKKRACQIIHELEISARGAYCGVMGYMNFDGTGNWNVLIRTLQKWQNTELWAGGGITIQSDMDSEYQECLDKVGNVIHMMHGK